jgi:dipeptidyl aminopeptidase/acylaminoacyl peptidase
MEKNFHYMDTSRAVALGASYGGFMMNWIQGHDLGRKFKALVTHDGIFSTKFALATEELYFPIHDLMGTYWESKEIWKKWDPSEFVPEWRTPHLVIHNTLDYRLSLAEGLATFNALQLQGVESAFLTFPDENHWVTKPENSLLWHKTVINWINKYVGLSPLEEKKKETGVFAAEAWRGVASERLLKPGAAESS